jgi:hypothetical protein
MESLRFGCVLSAEVHDNDATIAEAAFERKYRLPSNSIVAGYRPED